MRQIWNTLITAISTRFILLQTKFQRLSSPAYMFQQLIIKIRLIFNRMLDVRPKHKKDYYTIFGWMFSRRLVNLLLIIAGFVCIFYLSVEMPFRKSSEGEATTTVYSYASIPLRFASGNVRIKAKDGYIAYEGEVSKGYASGEGKLYDKEGTLIYDGEFSESKYNGTGVLYYSSGQMKYSGQFKDNLYEGTGVQYRESGSRLYEGAFADGMREGEGIYYSAADNPVFTGNFHLDDIVYTQLLKKTAEDIGALYTGTQLIYQSAEATENAVILSDIDVIYYSKDISDSMESTMKSDVLCVGESSFGYGHKKIDTIEGLTEALGKPEYEGNSYMTFLEAVGISWLQKQGKAMDIDTGMDLDAVFDEVNIVNSYEKNTTLYLHSYKVGEQTYTFISQERTGSFFMYEIE